MPVTFIDEVQERIAKYHQCELSGSPRIYESVMRLCFGRGQSKEAAS